MIIKNVYMHSIDQNRIKTCIVESKKFHIVTFVLIIVAKNDNIL